MKVRKIKHFSIFVTNLLELQLFVEFKRSFENLATKESMAIGENSPGKKKEKNPPPRILGYGWRAGVF